jgi:predicted nucleic acid-binding protein
MLPAMDPGDFEAVVLDTTVIAAFVFNEPNRALSRPICAQVQSDRLLAFVPDLMWAELQHVCVRKRDRDGLTQAEIDAAYGRAQALPLIEQDRTLERYRSAAWDLLARISGVGSYDMYFLALAIDLGVPLWTFDAALCRAVQNEGSHAERVRLVGGAG